MNTPLLTRFARAGAGLLLLSLLLACAPKYYSSNAQNVPLFTQQDEGTISASVNPELNRADARVAYAVSPVLALQANGAVYFPQDDSAGDGGSGGLFEAGVGHYRVLPHDMVLEVWALGAYGGVENHFTFDGGDGGKLNANLVRIAVQPALGYKSRWVEGALSSRMGMLNYFNIDGTLVQNDGENQQRYLRDNHLQFLIEPALTLRGGPDVLKLEAQIGRSFNVTDDTFPMDDLWASVGVVYSFQ
jgi:hypothetical protein